MKDIDCKNMSTVYDMLDGCNEAIVTYALNDKKQLIKTVTFYNRNEFSFESVEASCTYMCESQGDITLKRGFLYKVNSLLNVCKRGIEFYTMMLKDVPGFIPGSDTHDCRTNKRY